jgi:hypothetical protein
MFNENWNNEVTKSYLNLYNEDGTVANAPVFNKVEETVVEPVQLVENPETEEVIEEETTEEGDFLFSLIEDVQNSIGEELTEQEMQVIFETVAIVVEGMVKKMSSEKKNVVKEPKKEEPKGKEVPSSGYADTRDKNFRYQS